MIIDNSNQYRDKLKIILERRSREVLGMFGSEAVSELSESNVVSLLKGAKDYWKDIYRPALTSLSCEAVGGNPSATNEAALIVTLAAAGIGIHDDIIDQSEMSHFRRTIPGRLIEHYSLAIY